MSAPFKKVLVANRGEIAVRIQQTLQAMGIRTVAVYGDPDRLAPHVRITDEAYPLEGAAAKDTYLAIEKIVAIARRAEAQAIHPGYGFLAESAAFARACENAGLLFIGPPSTVLQRMGDKHGAKQFAASLGVPVAPAVLLAGVDEASAKEAAARLAFPLAAKAVAGGGGRGLRRIDRPEELLASVESASREAVAAFGDGRLLLEPWLDGARHIEVQVLADHHGNVASLGERNCSVQRRNQKLVEETPSPGIDDRLRERLFHAAVALAKGAEYRSAGTVEFLVAPDGRFFFLEMNTRLQVEHPVTEAVTGLDLVREQVCTAAGQPLSTQVRQAQPRGHAIECRVYAEDPYAEFAPSAGTLLRWAPPSGPGVRVDSGVAEGQEVTTHYDSLLAKVIAWGQDRESALARMEWALSRLVALGVSTTAPFLKDTIRHPGFRAGNYATGFLQQHPELFAGDGAKRLAPLANVLAAWASLQGPDTGRARHAPRATQDRSPWLEGGPWRLG